MLDEPSSLCQSLGVDDQEFNDNLQLLYERRVQQATRLCESLMTQMTKHMNQNEYVNSLLNQLQSNRNNAVAQMKIKHHMMVIMMD